MAVTAGVINGTDLRLYLGGNAIAYATSCTLDISRAERETIHKDNPGSGWKETAMGQKSGTLTVDVLVNEDGTNNTPYDLFTNLDNGTLLTAMVSTETADNTRLSFSCYCTSFSLTAAVEENSTYSAGFVIDGAVTKATIT